MGLDFCLLAFDTQQVLPDPLYDAYCIHIYMMHDRWCMDNSYLDDSKSTQTGYGLKHKIFLDWVRLMDLSETNNLTSFSFE